VVLVEGEATEDKLEGVWEDFWEEEVQEVAGEVKEEVVVDTQEQVAWAVVYLAVN